MSKPIRVSFVIDSLGRAGTESQLLALIRTLDRGRFEPSLVLLDGASSESQSLEPRDCPVLRLGVRKLFARRSFAAARELKRFWTAHRPDIVQAYFLDSAYFALPIAKLCGARMCLRVRNNLGYWLTRRHRILERCLRPLVDATLTNCDSAAEQLRNGGTRRVAVIENGVDLERFTSRDRKGTVIGCVANLRDVKNIDGLVRAAAIVRRRFPEVTFTVAGEGPERAKLEVLRNELGLRDCFHLPGSIRDVPRFLSNTAIAVLPSHSEGMSNALLEAMAAGCAVVATDVGANAAVLGDAGLIVPKANDEALAEAIIELIENRGLAARLEMRARRRVERNHSRDAMRQRFEEFYRDLLANSFISR